MVGLRSNSRELGASPSASPAVRWMFELDGDWQSWPEAWCDRLEQTYLKWRSEGELPKVQFTVTMKASDQKYIVSFANMIQKNCSTQKQRKLCRRESPSLRKISELEQELARTQQEVDESGQETRELQDQLQSLRACLVPRWQYLQDGEWRHFGEEANRRVEEEYASWTLGAPQVSLQVGAYTYELDFQNMEQRNSATGRTRRLRRREGANGLSAAVNGGPSGAEQQELREQVQRLRQENADLQNELDLQQEAKEELQKQLGDAQRNLVGLERVLKTSSALHEARLKQKCDVLGEVNDALKAKTKLSDEYREEISNLQQQLEEARNLEQRLNKVCAERKQLQSLLDSKDEVIQQLKQARSRVEIYAKDQEIERMAKSNKELHESLEAKKEEVQQLYASLRGCQRNLDQSQQANKKLESERLALTRQLRDMETGQQGDRLPRLQKMLGVTATAERSEEEVRKLQKGLIQQLSQKGHPVHWSKELAEVRGLEAEFEATRSRLQKLEERRNELQPQYDLEKKRAAKGSNNKPRVSSSAECAPFKIDFCHFFEQGNCNKGSTCPFAHGKAELRTRSLQKTPSSSSTSIAQHPVLREFVELRDSVETTKQQVHRMSAHISRLQHDHNLQQYEEAIQAGHDLAMLLDTDFALKLFRPGAVTREDRREIAREFPLFTFVKSLMIRSVTHHRLAYRSDEWCELAQFDILAINTCINPELSTRYKFEQMKLAQKHPDGVQLPKGVHALELDAKVGELALFHGCKKEVLPQILKQGFDFRIAGGNAGTMFGRGAYFAENASKSDLYSSPDDDGVRHMILAKVLVGKTHVQKERNTSLCRPPDDRIVQAAGDGLYDSVMGERRDMGGEVDHREFIVYHQNRAVPVAVIAYKHREECECNLCRRGS